MTPLNIDYFKCKKCNEVKAKSEFVKNSGCKHGIEYRCIKCQYQYRKKCIKSMSPEKKADFNKKTNTLQKRWMRANPERHKRFAYEYNANWKKNNPEKQKESVKRSNKKISVNLTDSYVRHMLAQKGFSKEQIEKYPELMQVHKINTQIKRLCKTSQN